MATHKLTSIIDPGLVVGYTEDEDDEPKLGLLDADFEVMLTEPYDPLWISTYNIDPSIVESFQSNQTLERLFKNNAIKVGDEIYCRCSHKTEEGTAVFEKTAKVVGMNQESTKPYFIRPHITVTYGICQSKDLRMCRSPKEILAAINEIEPKDSFDVLQAWHTLQLRRGPFELGSLHDVRQAWHLWKQAMFLWTASKGMEFPKTRSPKKKIAGHQQVASFKNGSKSAEQQHLHPQSSNQFNQPAANQTRDHLPSPVFQPESQSVRSMQTIIYDGLEPNYGTSHADGQSPDQSSDLPPPVFQPVYEFQDPSTFRYPWQIENRPMYPYEQEAVASIRRQLGHDVDSSNVRP